LEQCNGCTDAWEKYYDCGGGVCLVHRVYFDVNINLRSTKIPIIGNTQDAYDDYGRSNSFLDWYLNGNVFHSDQQTINPDNPTEISRVVNFGGPVQKLLSEVTQVEVREILKDQPPLKTEVHNSIIKEETFGFKERINDAGDLTKDYLYKYAPFSTVEDTTSEVTVGLIPDQQPANPDGEIILSCGDRPFEIAYNRKSDSSRSAADKSDGRIYVPHVRTDNTLTNYLTATFRKQAEDEDKRILTDDDELNKDLVSNKIPVHQGIDDATLVQRHDYLTGSNTRNTEVGGTSVEFPDRYKAPEPLFRPADPLCEEIEVRTNRGDNLVGSIFDSTLVYYMNFRYTPSYRIKNPNITGCAVEGSTCYQTSDCCDEVVGCTQPDLEYDEFGDPIEGRCNPWPRKELQSHARVATFTKTPLIERIYSELVVGEESLMRRFLPKRPDNLPLTQEYLKGEIDPENALKAEDKALYMGSTNDLNGPRVGAGNETSPADIFYDRIGSLSDHILGDPTLENLNLQRLLRPRFYPVTLNDPVGPPAACGSGTCTIPTSGYCSPTDPVTQFPTYFDCPDEAAQICFRESGGSATVINDHCLSQYLPHYPAGQHTADYSVGLFQINMLAHPNTGFLITAEAQRPGPDGRSLAQIIAQSGKRSCYEAFSNWYEINRGAFSLPCDPILDQPLLDGCVSWFSDPVNNTAYASFMSHRGASWGAWAAAAACGIN